MKLIAAAYLHLFLFLALQSFSSQTAAQEYITPDFAVSDASGFFYESPELSINNAGDLVVVWETSGAGDIWFRTLSSSGDELEPVQQMDTPPTTAETRIIHNDSGNFMIIFGAYRGTWYILGQSFSSTGVPLTDTMVVDRNTTEMINFFRSSLHSNREGQFAAFLPGQDSVIVELFSASGEYLSNPVVLKPEATIPMEMNGIMTYAGDLILIWMDGSNGDIRGQRYSADGTPVGDVFQVSNKVDNCFLSNSRICADTAGNFAVGWTSTLNGQITMYAQLFDKAGISIGENIKITDDNTSFNGLGLSMDMDLDGKFVLAWPDSRGGDTSFIYMQQVSGLGIPVGGNFRATSVNNQVSPGTPLPSQDHPDVRILRDTIYLTWANYNEELHYRDMIYANVQKWQIHDITGLPVSGYPAESMSLFPNPSPGSFTLQLPGEVRGDLELSVFNPAGALMYRKELNPEGQPLTIDLPDLRDGVFYMEVRGDSYRSVSPLIIQK